MRGPTIAICALFIGCGPGPRDTGGGDDTSPDASGDGASAKSTTPTTGRTIVGAGVSTCAPTVIF